MASPSGSPRLRTPSLRSQSPLPISPRASSPLPPSARMPSERAPSSRAPSTRAPSPLPLRPARIAVGLPDFPTRPILPLPYLPSPPSRPPSAFAGPAIGIDLGTTNCCVAVWRHNSVEIIPNDQGYRTTPSCVAFTRSGILVGNSAKNQAASNAANTVLYTKRMIGRRFDDLIVHWQRDMATWPFKVVRCAEGGGPLVSVQCCGEKRTFSPEEISSMLLRKMKEIAEASLDCEIKNAVITVPATFNQSQKMATKQAALRAGLTVLRLITEPAAAAIAYAVRVNGVSGQLVGRLSVEEPPRRTVMVVDWGGGTFDVSIMRVNGDRYEVVALAGDTHLGGEDVDDRLVRHFAKEFEFDHGIDVRQSQRALRRLRSHCQELKHQLSFSPCASTQIDSLCDGIDYPMELSRSRFEELCADLFARCMKLVEKAVSEAKLDKSEISEVILAGGSTRIPMIQEMLAIYFGGKHPSKSIHPDECVAYGASVCAAMLTGDLRREMNDLCVVDVTPLSIGFRNCRGRFIRMIPRNTPYPTKKIVQARGGYDGQTAFAFPVHEGEREWAKENQCLGTLLLEGLQPGPPGSPTERVPVQCILEIDSDGILTGTLVDQVTGRSVRTTLSCNVLNMSEKDVSRIVEDAKKARAADELLVERTTAKYDLMAYIQKVRRRFMLVAGSEEIRRAELALGSAERWMERGAEEGNASGELLDPAEYNKKRRALEEVCGPIIERIRSF